MRVSDFERELYGTHYDLGDGYELVEYRHPMANKGALNYHFLSPSGSNVGWLQIYRDYDGAVALTDIILHPEGRGLGLGGRAVMVLRGVHGPITSDPQGNTSPAAVRMWNRLGAQRVPTTKNAKGYKYHLETATEYPHAGAEVDGLVVLDDVPNTGSIAASLTDYEVLPGIRAVPLSEFVIGPRFFYAADDDRRARALAVQIEVSGALKPLIVVLDAEGPYVLEGAHRLYALHLLGKTAAPAMVVRDLS